MGHKILSLMRHATAESAQFWQNDFQRPLNQQGRQEAINIAKTLKNNAFTIDYLISSPARRTQETSEIIKKNAGTQPHLQIQQADDLYDGDLDVYLKVLSKLSDDVHCPILVGHNPSISILAESLLAKSIAMPPATLIRLTLPITAWSEIERFSGNLIDYAVFSCESAYCD